ncbi:MAG: DUF5664 domain-containing protein [Negativicutes bacterium]|nr:DUF5664 domain-containing protein [Negativicutes bacterium]
MNTYNDLRLAGNEPIGHREPLPNHPDYGVVRTSAEAPATPWDEHLREAAEAIGFPTVPLGSRSGHFGGQKPGLACSHSRSGLSSDFTAPEAPTGLTTDSDERKGIPLATGLLDYFPDALAAVARLSKIGNDKHNPGEPLHWSRDKSSDHADCLLRHLIERGTMDTDGELHDVKVAWRALANLQIALEKQKTTKAG